MRSGEKRARKFAKELRAKMTDAEVILWSFLREHPKYRFRRQHPVGRISPTSLALHLGSSSKSTAQRAELTTSLRMTAGALAIWNVAAGGVIRITNEDVYKSLSSVIDYIEAEVSR